jgi:hypothetical protein
MKIHALFISTSIRPNRDRTVSTIFAAVPGSQKSPSTSTRFADAGNRLILVMFREFTTPLKPSFWNTSTSPAPIPCEAPVTIDVFRVFAFLLLLSALSEWYESNDVLPFLKRIFAHITLALNSAFSLAIARGLHLAPLTMHREGDTLVRFKNSRTRSSIERCRAESRSRGCCASVAMPGTWRTARLGAHTIYISTGYYNAS